MQAVIARESNLRERDPDLIWSAAETLSIDMSAIALVYTESGFVVAADGRARCTDDDNPMNKGLIRKGVWEEQKIFSDVFCGSEVSLAMTGATVFDYARRYCLISIVRKAMRETSDTYGNTPSPIGKKLATLTLRLDSLLSDAQRQRIVSFVRRPTIIAQIFIIGYFGDNREPAMTVLKLSHSNGLLLRSDVWTQYPPIDVLAGSQEIVSRYLGRDEDKRFLRHFHAPGPSLEDGLAYTTGFIEACKDEMAKTVDPDIHDRIGGHVHAAFVTPSGFRWRIEPMTNGEKLPK